MNRKALLRSCLETFKVFYSISNLAGLVADDDRKTIHELARINSHRSLRFRAASCGLVDRIAFAFASETLYCAIATQDFPNRISRTDSIPKTSNKLTAA